MADLKDKVEDALNESRMLVLGVQVLLGFQYQVVFQSEFPRLTPSAQSLHLVGLGFDVVDTRCVPRACCFRMTQVILVCCNPK